MRISRIFCYCLRIFLASDPYLWLLAVLHGHLLATPGVFAEVDGAEGPIAELAHILDDATREGTTTYSPKEGQPQGNRQGNIMPLVTRIKHR